MEQPRRNREQHHQPDIPALPSDEVGRDIHRQLLHFVLDDRQDCLRLGYKASRYRRRTIHQLAEAFGLLHQSSGADEDDKHVAVWKKGVRDPDSQKRSRRSCSNPSYESHQQPTREELRAQLERFVQNSALRSINFPTWFSRESRVALHELATEMQLDHDSFGERGRDRYVRVTKVDEEIRRKRQEKQNGLNVAYSSYLDKVKEASTRTDLRLSRAVIQHATPTRHQQVTLRFVQWNVEWMDYFFDASSGELLPHNQGAEISDTTSLCCRIAQVIEQLAPDVIAIEEGPSNIERMQLFVRTFLGDKYAVLGGLENLTQQLYLLVRRDGPVKNAVIHEPSLEFLTNPFWWDIDGDRSLHDYRFTRRPLVVKSTVGTTDTFFVVLHLKSKFVAKGRSMWQSMKADQVEQFVNKSIANRRRIQAECQRTRECIQDVILAAYPPDKRPAVIVSGDLNDGPGSDFFSSFYGMVNILDALLGSRFYRTETLFPVLDCEDDTIFSCEFDDYVDNISCKKSLLDHVFVSRRLRDAKIQATVAHDVFQASMLNGGKTRQDRPSDHRPVVADFKF